MQATESKAGASDCDLLERIVNRGTLSTQRTTHRQILVLGDKLCKVKKKKKSHTTKESSKDEPQLPVLEDDSDSEDSAIQRLEEQLLAVQAEAVEERECALEQQRQTLKAYYEQILRNRDHLEEERLYLLSVRLRAEADEALRQRDFEQEQEQKRAIDEACRVLALRLQKDAEAERHQAIQRALVEAETGFAARLEQTTRKVRQDCERQAQRDMKEKQWRHNQELRCLQEEIARLRHEVSRVNREKMRYEKEFKEVQVNYKRFIDLTDCGLHSDYLLKLRALGRPPGMADQAVQTDAGQRNLIKAPLDRII
ncbi:golgin subfamily A member 6-like protein 22 [Polypterus senegalus]|uniref:golgin subfamily A member 6-like protein 22 n=1 Tax=Polypterus senegalus TaxID=55291 RepID=UPI001963D394|nr:golgin subfamily A member 6-like protein 22 [Polypterus senegalus]